MSDGLPCNPRHKTNLGASVADALLGRKPRKLQGLKRFDGAGIYALYYQGMYAPYRRLAALNQGDDPQAPIYIGKAIPEGGRKGGGEATIHAEPAGTQAQPFRSRIPALLANRASTTQAWAPNQGTERTLLRLWS